MARSSDATLLGRFLISDAIYKALRENLRAVKLEASSLQAGLVQGLSEMGFTGVEGSFIRFCLAGCFDREDALSTIAASAPVAVANYRDMSLLELERYCSPLSVAEEQNRFLMPIRPGYALNLFDRQQSSGDLFGGNPERLLRWSNVYYRKKYHHNMLKEPGRILWYVSRNPKAIVAVSHLDEVVIDTPKELFKRFRRHGTLEWDDLYKMCGGDVAESLMALRFSHTFPLQRNVPLAEIWKTFDEDGIGRSLQSPRKLPFGTFNKLLQVGYPELS